MVQSSPVQHIAEACRTETANGYGLSIKDVHSQGERTVCPVRIFCGQGEGDFFKCERLHFWRNNLGFFEIYGVSTRIRGFEPVVRTYFGQGGRGSIFRDFVQATFMDGPLGSCSI